MKGRQEGGRDVVSRDSRRQVSLFEFLRRADRVSLLFLSLPLLEAFLTGQRQSCFRGQPSSADARE